MVFHFSAKFDIKSRSFLEQKAYKHQLFNPIFEEERE